MKLVVSLILASLMFANLSGMTGTKTRRPQGDPELAKKIRRFEPTVLTADTSRLTPGDRKALKKIIAAAKLMDPLFLRQVWNGNTALHQKLMADTTRISFSAFWNY